MVQQKFLAWKSYRSHIWNSLHVYLLSVLLEVFYPYFIWCNKTIQPATVNHSTLFIFPESFKEDLLKKLSVDLMSAQMMMVATKSTFTLIDYFATLIFPFGVLLPSVPFKMCLLFLIGVFWAELLTGVCSLFCDCGTGDLHAGFVLLIIILFVFFVWCFFLFEMPPLGKPTGFRPLADSTISWSGEQLATPSNSSESWLGTHSTLHLCCPGVCLW